jgi:hypothetical protein
MTRARIVAWSLWVGLLGLATACEASRYGHVDLYQVGGHGAADIGPAGITVPEGGVIVFEAQPRAERASPPYKGWERFKLRVTDTRVALAYRAILRDTWVVGGLSVGTTRLQVLIDGEVVDDVPVEIVAAEEVAP